MSIWIRVLCRRLLGDRFAVQPLKAAMDRLDFASMAESNGLADELGDAAEEALRIEGDDDPNLLFIHCRPGEEHFIRVESWQGSAADEEIAELLESVEDAEGAGAERVRAHLGSTVQSVAFELKASDLTGMGLPIVFYAAMWLAEQGDGLVEYEDDWFDPSVSYVDAILDA